MESALTRAVSSAETLARRITSNALLWKRSRAFDVTAVKNNTSELSYITFFATPIGTKLHRWWRIQIPLTLGSTSVIRNAGIGRLYTE